MSDTEILDSQEIDNGIVLYSKWSIILSLILFSPILAGFIYCLNLKKSNQHDKIISTYLTILLIQLLSSFPFLGFKLNFQEFNVIPCFSLIIIIGILIGPMWSKQFSHLDYRTKFPVKPFLIISAVFLLSKLIENALIYYAVPFESVPSFYLLINFSIASTWIFFQYLFMGRLIYILFFNQKKRDKANDENTISTEN